MASWTKLKELSKALGIEFTPETTYDELKDKYFDSCDELIVKAGGPDHLTEALTADQITLYNAMLEDGDEAILDKVEEKPAEKKVPPKTPKVSTKSEKAPKTPAIKKEKAPATPKKVAPKAEKKAAPVEKKAEKKAAPAEKKAAKSTTGKPVSKDTSHTSKGKRAGTEKDRQEAISAKRVEMGRRASKSGNRGASCVANRKDRKVARARRVDSIASPVKRSHHSVSSRYSRIAAVCDIFKKGGGSFDEIAVQANTLYAKNGGTNNLKESKFYTNHVITVLRNFDLILQGEDKILTLRQPE